MQCVSSDRKLFIQQQREDRAIFLPWSGFFQLLQTDNICSPAGQIKLEFLLKSRQDKWIFQTPQLTLRWRHIRARCTCTCTCTCSVGPPEQILVWWPAGWPGQVCHIQPAEQRGRSVAVARVNRDPIHHCTAHCTLQSVPPVLLIYCRESL